MLMRFFTIKGLSPYSNNDCKLIILLSVKDPNLLSISLFIVLVLFDYKDCRMLQS